MTDDGNKKVLCSLSIDEGETIIEALAELPFKYVFELIGNINKQGNVVAGKNCGKNDVSKYTFNRQEIELIFAALGKLPFNRVHIILENLNSQISE